ncbi:MAG TPA: response regulator [Thermoanaerobaculia bacterium]|nr:response regulator [Thermoanaerobaculia bacterium]
MKTVLVVDDEPTVLFALSEGLCDKKKGLKVATAGNGREAVERLESERVDLVLTDLRMPDMDGFELLTYIRRNFANLPVIIMTALGSSETDRRLGSDSGFEILTKPFNVPALKLRISEMLAQRFKGRIENITLASFLQLLEMERKTCTLSITSVGRKGRLHFKGGRLTGAATGELEGQDAALEIVTWEHADIEISDGVPPGGPTIDTTLRFLLMEGMRLKDEREGGVAPPEVDLEPDEVLQTLAPSTQPAPAPSRTAPDLAARVGDSLKKAGLIKGSAALLLAEIASGSVIGAVGDSAGVDLGIATAVAMAQLLRQKQRVTDQLGLHDPVQEILLTSADRYYVARSLGLGDGYFLLLILDRDKANLARAQLDLVAIERDLVERVSS